jgi:CheY-like chemotaxis protein
LVSSGAGNRSQGAHRREKDDGKSADVEAVFGVMRIAAPSRNTDNRAARKPPGIETSTAKAVRVLSVSPVEGDHTGLQDILQNAEAGLGSHCQWRLCPIRTLASAADALQQQAVPIIISACELLPGSWREMLAQISLLPDPPLLIVTSRLADDSLWAEALNLGAWDVIVKPFDATEVTRILNSAWQHWLDRKDVHHIRTKQRTAAAGT